MMARRAIGLPATLCLLLLIAISVACTGATEVQAPIPTLTPFPPDLYIGLTDSAGPLADIVSTGYAASPSSRAPIFLSGNDDVLLNDVQQGELEAAIVHHLPADSPLWFTPVALDGVVLITNPSLDLDALSGSQLQGILSGAITNWAEVGGPDLAIELLVRESGSGTREILQNRIMQNARFSTLARIVPTDAFMKQEVLANPGTIGFTMMGSADSDSLLLDGQEATPDTVATQSYPLTTPIYFVSLAEPIGPMRDYLAWLQSMDGQEVLGEKYGRVR